jgi:hypothetical protein
MTIAQDFRAFGFQVKVTSFIKKGRTFHHLLLPHACSAVADMTQL